MRRTSDMLINLSVGIALLVVVLLVIQLLAPQIFVGLMNASQSPIGLTAQAENTQEADPLPTSSGLTPMDVDVEAGDLLIAVTNVYRPANQYLGSEDDLLLLNPDEEFMLVTFRIKCNALKACRLEQSEFGIQTSNGIVYPPRDPINHPNVNGLLSTSVLGGEKTVKGGIFYIVSRAARGMILYYPMSSGLDGAVQFDLP